MFPLKRSAKRDPAPSRIAYKLNRLWLRPNFRKIVRVVMPTALVLGAIGFWVSDEQRLNQINDMVAQMRTSIEERPEFMVKLMSIEGASPGLINGIREVVPVNFPISSFDLDLEAMREQVESLDAIKKVDIRVKAGGLLQVNVEERSPAVIWRGPDGLVLLDDEGHRVRPVEFRSNRPDLPLIVGEGARAKIEEALLLVQEAAPIADRLLGFVWMSEARWDLVLDGDQRILLPETEPRSALARVIALHEAQDLLGRGVRRVDIRNGKRPTLQLTEDAITARRVSMGFEVNKEQE
jgi:cell division protein FtsQ